MLEKMLEQTTCPTLSFNKNNELHYSFYSGHRHHLSVFPVPISLLRTEHLRVSDSYTKMYRIKIYKEIYRYVQNCPY